MPMRNEDRACYICSNNQDTYKEGSKSQSDCYGKQIMIFDMIGTTYQ